MSYRVLLIEDDVGVRAAVKKVLQRAGYEVVVAGDAREALTEFERGGTDLVLLDLNLPFQNGWDLFERLTTQSPTVPVIIMTAMPNQYEVALAAGAGALLEKPIDAPFLLDTIDRMLKEPKENRLRRLCGYSADTVLVPPAALSRARTRSPSPHCSQHWQRGSGA